MGEHMDNVRCEIDVIDLDIRQWEFLNNRHGVCAQVQNFKHVLLQSLCRQLCRNVAVDLPVIVEFVYYIDSASLEDKGEKDSSKMDTSNNPRFREFYWPARIMRLEGYYVLLKFESINANSQFIWAHLLSGQIFPVGYSPEKKIQPRKPNKCFIGPHSTKDLLLQFISNCYLGEPSTFPCLALHNILNKKLMKLKFDRLILNPKHEMLFKKDMEVEIRDAVYINEYRLGRVTDIIGTRVEVTHPDLDENDNVIAKTVWCDKESHTIQPCGWSKTVGHYILPCDDSYNPKELDTSGSKYEDFDYENICIGHKLEVICPLDRSQLHVAMVVKLLKYGYVMVRAEVGSGQGNTTDFCVHLSSHEIFPLGFSDSNNIVAVTPFETQSNKKFSEIEIQNLQLVPDPLLKNSREPRHIHHFAENMKLEAADWFNVDRNRICPATIIRVVGDGNYELLKIRYDGYGEELHQWVAPSSCEIYPVGYSALVRCPLQPSGSKQFKKRLRTESGEEYRLLTDASEDLTESDEADEFEIDNPDVNPVDDSPDIMASDTIDRALNPSNWTSNDVNQFLKLNDYWGLELELFEQMRDFDGPRLMALTSIDVRRMMKSVKDRISSCESMVSLINYLRILHWGSYC